MPRGRKKSYQCKSKYMALRRSLETPEQRAIRLEKTRIRAAHRISCESEQKRSERLALARTRVNSKRSNLINRARSFNISELMKNGSNVPGDKVSGLNKIQKAAYEALLLIKTQREAAAQYAKIRRSQETPEQRAARLEKGRIRAAVVRSQENEEKRATRLARQRVRTYMTRLHKANKDSVEQFCNNKMVCGQIALKQLHDLDLEVQNNSPLIINPDTLKAIALKQQLDEMNLKLPNNYNWICEKMSVASKGNVVLQQLCNMYIRKQSCFQSNYQSFQQSSNITNELNGEVIVGLEKSLKEIKTTDYEQSRWKPGNFAEIDYQRLAYQTYLLEEAKEKREDVHVECEVTIEEEDDFTKPLIKEESFPEHKIKTVFCNCETIKQEVANTENSENYCDGRMEQEVYLGKDASVDLNNQGLLSVHQSLGNLPVPLKREDGPDPLNLTLHQAGPLDS